MSHERILIMAGGTGGHVYPALAVADSLRKHGTCILWLGTDTGLEARVVPASGHSHHGLGPGWSPSKSDGGGSPPVIESSHSRHAIVARLCEQDCH